MFPPGRKKRRRRHLSPSHASNSGTSSIKMFPHGRRKRRRRSESAPSPGSYKEESFAMLKDTARLGSGEEREMRETWGKIGKEALCEMVEIGTAWNLLKTSF